MNEENKMRIIAALIITIFFQTNLLAQETDIKCTDLAGIGRSVMMVRQSGVPIDKATTLVLNGLKERSPEDQKILDPVFRKIVELAYQEKQFSTNRERIDATADFAQTILKRCERRLPRS